jgi:DNA-binding transcriptional MerR regulator
VSGRDYLTIGEVVEALESAHPDLSISKVRFLEEEGLITPERTAGGYRKFSSDDVGRIEMILRLQKDHFLPLAIIRDKLADYDKGKVPPELRGGMSGRSEKVSLPLENAETVLVEDAPTQIGLPVSFVKELEEFHLIELVDGSHGSEITRADVNVLHAAWDLRRFGVEPRHLRMYETFAEREATFFAQILTPAFRHRTPETRQKLIEALTGLSELTGQLKGDLLHKALGAHFEDLV